jgi:hypothetical protein
MNNIAAVNSEKAGKKKTHDWVPFFQIVAKGLLYIAHLLSTVYGSTKRFELKKIDHVFWFHFQYIGDPEWLVDLKAKVDGPKKLSANALSSSSSGLPPGLMGSKPLSPMSTGPTYPNMTKETKDTMSWYPQTNPEQYNPVIGGGRKAKAKAKRGGASFFGQTIHIPWYETMKPAPIPDGRLRQIMDDNLRADPIRPPIKDGRPANEHELMIPLETLEEIFGDKSKNPVQQCNSQLLGLKVAGKKRRLLKKGGKKK